MHYEATFKSIARKLKIYLMETGTFMVARWSSKHLNEGGTIASGEKSISFPTGLQSWIRSSHGQKGEATTWELNKAMATDNGFNGTESTYSFPSVPGLCFISYLASLVHLSIYLSGLIKPKVKLFYMLPEGAELRSWVTKRHYDDHLFCLD